VSDDSCLVPVASDAVRVARVMNYTRLIPNPEEETEHEGVHVDLDSV